jgi:hypothetical protein
MRVINFIYELEPSIVSELVWPLDPDLDQDLVWASQGLLGYSRNTLAQSTYYLLDLARTILI